MDGIRPFHPTHNYNGGFSADTIRDEKNRHIHSNFSEDTGTSLEQHYNPSRSPSSSRWSSVTASAQNPQGQDRGSDDHGGGLQDPLHHGHDDEQQPSSASTDQNSRSGGASGGSTAHRQAQHHHQQSLSRRRGSAAGSLNPRPWNQSGP